MDSKLGLGFKDAAINEVFAEGNYKLVPWISWDDWNFVRESLFSSSPAAIDGALLRISAWRSRGCLPIVIEVTASIVEIQQKDSYFRDGLSESDLLAEDMLTMLYCMTIMRLVNGIVEKTRKKNEVSIAEAADVIGIPRMLIDIRHECSHRDLPSLRLVRLASTKALDWLKAYYWEPQKMAIAHPTDSTANFRKEIKSKIRELAFLLVVKQAAISGSAVVKGKRSKKHINKILKNLLKLYSSCTSEVLSILLEFLMKALESADVAEVSNTRLADWKPLIMKLSNKEPGMLLSLLKTVIQMIETREALQHESGGEHLKPPEGKSGIYQTERLSYLFEWLVGNLTDLKFFRLKITNLETRKKTLPKSSLLHILRKCLAVSSLGNNAHLATATSILAKTAGNHTLLEKLNKLASLNTSNTVEETAPDCSGRFYDHQENSIREAAEKLELLKQKLSKKSNSKPEKKSLKWTVAKSWNPCPIGMLPSDLGSSGVVPVLDGVEECKEKEEVNRLCGKREADCPVGVLDDSDVKKVKTSERVDDEDGLLEGVKNRLLIGGVWKRVTEDEVMNMASNVRILV